MNNDGSLIYPKVSLTPSNWYAKALSSDWHIDQIYAGRAWIARRKMLFGVDGTRTASQVTWEISNLEKKNRMIEALQEVIHVFSRQTSYSYSTEHATADRVRRRSSIRSRLGWGK